MMELENAPRISRSCSASPWGEVVAELALPAYIKQVGLPVYRVNAISKILCYQ
jgi:hypothetical protein